MSMKHPKVSPLSELSDKSKDHTNNAIPAFSTPLDTRQAASYLNIQPGTLEQWRWSGKGPRFCKIGRSVRYRPPDLDAYLAERTFTSTTEAQAA